MNYLYLLIEVIIIYLLMLLFYKIYEKKGLYLYIGLIASILAITLSKSIDIFSFQVNLDISLIMGIFVCSNVIIQRYGIDEVKRIICTFAFTYITSFIVVCLITLISPSGYNMITNTSFDNLFGYSIDNLRYGIATMVSVLSMIWCGSYIYHYVRRSKNNLLFSNISVLLLIQFMESILFVIISYAIEYDAVMIIGMIVMRYLAKVIIGMIGLCPVYLLVKWKEW